MYDSLGGNARGTIRWDKDLLSVKKVFRTNVLEDDEGEVEIGKGGNSASIALRAFEVATFRLQL